MRVGDLAHVGPLLGRLIAHFESALAIFDGRSVRVHVAVRGFDLLP